MNKYLFAIASILFACGGAPDVANGNTPEEQLQEDIDNAAVFGQTEEAINVGNGGYGFTNASSQLRCAQPGLSGQVCFASAVKVNATYCFTGSPSFTNTEKTLIDQGMQLVNGQSGGNWHFAMSSFPCDIVFQSSTNQSGSTSANIENFMTATPGGTLTALTSPAGTSHINGSWTSFNALSVVIKTTKLQIVTTGAPYNTIIKQMGSHAGLLYGGLGVQQDTSSTGLGSPSRRLLDFNGTVGVPPTTLTPGETCRLRFQGVGTPNQISAIFGCGF